MRLFRLRNVSPISEVTMRHQRKTETPEERSLRLVREAQMKKDEAAANEAAIDRLIRQNIAQFGP
jgi:hypothetical protein